MIKRQVRPKKPRTYTDEERAYARRLFDNAARNGALKKPRTNAVAACFTFGMFYSDAPRTTPGDYLPEARRKLKSRKEFQAAHRRMCRGRSRSR